jgi:uncharacterized membrane protein
MGYGATPGARSRKFQVPITGTVFIYDIMRLINLLITSLLWLQVFIVPTGILGFVAFLLYKRSATNLPFSIIIAGAEVAGGILLAERIRRGRGLAETFGRLLSTPELYSEKERRGL